MPQETAFLTSYAVMWEKTGEDDYNNIEVASPVEIRCRWEIDRRETKDAKGNTVTLSAVAFVDREIPINSILWNGRLSDLTGTGTSANPNDDLHQVVNNDTIPDIKGRAVQRTVEMMRYSKSLPFVS